jgi:F-type H+-transporting ATPase subunit b
MRLALSCRLFAVAAVAALAAAGTALADKDDKHDPKAKPTLFVEHDGHHHPATEAQIKAAAAALGDHGHKGEGGLSFTGIKRWDLGIYTLIVFGLLLFIVIKFAWPHIKEGLEKRETNIRSALDQAKQEQAAAAALLGTAKKEVDDAAAKVKAMLDEARRDADALRVTEREAGAKDAAAERERAKREIDAAKDAALKDIYEQAVKLASLMSEKALRRNVSAEDHRRLLDESIAELKSGASKA